MNSVLNQNMFINARMSSELCILHRKQEAQAPTLFEIQNYWTGCPLPWSWRMKTGWRFQSQTYDAGSLHHSYIGAPLLKLLSSATPLWSWKITVRVLEWWPLIHHYPVWVVLWCQWWPSQQMEAGANKVTVASHGHMGLGSENTGTCLEEERWRPCFYSKNGIKSSRIKRLVGWSARTTMPSNPFVSSNTKSPNELENMW